MHQTLGVSFLNFGLLFGQWYLQNVQITYLGRIELKVLKIHLLAFLNQLVTFLGLGQAGIFAA